MPKLLWIVGLVGLAATINIGLAAYANPPPDADGKFHDWFRSLKIPGSPVDCCKMADCRMVEARWNAKTQQYEAKVIRDEFSDALRHSPSHLDNDGADNTARKVWMRNWFAKYGEATEVWIDIPEDRINRSQNPTGHSVLCWSIFYQISNGVYCFVPFSAV